MDSRDRETLASLRARADEADALGRDLLLRLGERVAILDGDDRVLLATEALAALIGRDPGALRGVAVSELLTPPHVAGLDPSPDGPEKDPPRDPRMRVRIAADGVYCARIEALPGGRRALVLEPDCATPVPEHGEPWARELADAMPQLVWTATPDGTVDYYNRRHEEYAGIERSADGSWRWAAVVHPEDRDATVAAWERAVATGTPYEVEHRIQLTDRRFEWHVSRGVPVKDERGDVTRWFGTATNVHALKRAQEALAEEHTLLDAVLEGTSDAVFVKDREGRYLLMNRAGAAVRGLRPEDVVGRDDAALVPAEIAAEVREHDLEVMRSRARACLDERWVGLDMEEERVFEAVKAPLLGADGDVSGIIGVARDVTETRRVARVLRESEERLRQALVIGRAFTFEWIAEGDRLLRSPECGPILGLEREQGGCDTRACFLERVHPADRAAYAAAFRGLSGADTYALVYRVLRSDGAVVALEERGRAEHEGERLVRVLGIAADVSERHRIEGALRASEERFRLATEALAGLVYEWDVASGRVWRSAGLEQLVGVRPEDTNESSVWWQEQVHPDDRSRALGEVSDAISRGAPVVASEYRVRHRDGRWIWVWDQARIAYDDEGEPARVIGCTVDVDARRRAEQALRDADRRKDDFMAMLGHELRNPLGPIRTSVELLQALPALPPIVVRAREVIGRQVRQMAALIDDLLDVSRVSRGKVVLRREPCDLAAIVRNVAEDHRSAIESAGLSLGVDAPAAPVMLVGDATRLAQIIGNLLDNAAKFTPSGGHIAVRLSRDDARRQASLVVEDTGIGMEPATLARVFEPFAQADQTLERQKGGLGLALVKGLAELHGGQASAESAGLDRGARLRVTLPLAEHPEVSTRRPAPDGPTGPLRILVIEDNIDAADMLALFLESQGHLVEVEHDGEHGLAKAREAHPDVVLCDLGLPGMDGFEVARAIRRDPRLDDVRLAAQTGYGRAEDIDRAREAGFDVHLRKPIELDVLRGFLSTVHP